MTGSMIILVAILNGIPAAINAKPDDEVNTHLARASKHHRQVKLHATLIKLLEERGRQDDAIPHYREVQKEFDKEMKEKDEAENLVKEISAARAEKEPAKHSPKK